MNSELTTIQGECSRRAKELAHTIDTHARTEAAIDNRGWCNLHLPELALHYKGKSDEYWRLYRLWFGVTPENPTEREIDDQIREARLYKFGQIAFLLVETIAAAVLAATYFNAPALVAAIIGVIIAFLLGTAALAGVTRWVRHEAHGQPTKQLARITRGLLVLGLPWLIACVTALAILRSQGTGLGSLLFLISTTTVTLFSPLCSGLCGYAADLLRWSKRLCADLRWIRSLRRDLDHLLTMSERSIPTTPGGPGVQIPLVLRAIAPPVSVAVFLIAALCSAPTIGHAADLPVYLYADVSTSARGGDVTSILKSFTGKVSTYEGAETLTISVVPFYEQAFMATAVVRISIPGTRQVACPAGAVMSEIARLSRTAEEAARRESQRKCDGLRDQARREAAVQRSAEIAKLTAAIDNLAGRKFMGRCTAVNAMIRRAATESPNGISVIISDLLNSCASIAVPASIRPENRVFVIPVGSHQRSIEESFDAIQARLGRSLPWLQVVESYRMDAIMEAIVHPELRLASRR